MQLGRLVSARKLKFLQNCLQVKADVSEKLDTMQKFKYLLISEIEFKRPKFCF